METFYKLRRKGTNLYVVTAWGGIPNFTSRGRVFRGIAPLRSHFASMLEKRAKYYEKCEVVEFSLEEQKVYKIEQITQHAQTIKQVS